MNNSKHIIDITPENLTAAIERSMDIPVLLDFWAPWCQPCQTLLPIVENLAKEYDGKFLLAKVNIDEQPDLASHFGVRSVPTVKLIRNGALVDEFAGALPESQIRAFLERHMEQPADKFLMAAEQAHAAGDTDAATALLQQAMSEVPEDYRAQLMLAELHAISGDTAAAEALLASLPADQGLSEQAEALRARLGFAALASNAPDATALLSAIEQNPDDFQARQQLSARLVETGEIEAALQQLLEILRRDRHWNDDAARKGMVQIFELLGGQGELVSRYRRLMANLLH